METVYKKYRPAGEILMEYYWYYEHRDYLRDDWKKEDNQLKEHCDKLYKEYYINKNKRLDSIKRQKEKYRKQVRFSIPN